MSLYCTNGPGHWKYLPPMAIFGIVVLKMVVWHVGGPLGTNDTVGSGKWSIIIPMMTLSFKQFDTHPGQDEHSLREMMTNIFIVDK
jgi:hypothetical protein